MGTESKEETAVPRGKGPRQKATETLHSPAETNLKPQREDPSWKPGLQKLIWRGVSAGGRSPGESAQGETAQSTGAERNQYSRYSPLFGPLIQTVINTRMGTGYRGNLSGKHVRNMKQEPKNENVPALQPLCSIPGNDPKEQSKRQSEIQTLSHC